MCWKVIRLRAWKLLTIMGSRANIIVRTCKENIHFDYEEDTRMSSKYYEKNEHGIHLDLLRHLVLIACFIS